jgi:hypothetical protein
VKREKPRWICCETKLPVCLEIANISNIMRLRKLPHRSHNCIPRAKAFTCSYNQCTSVDVDDDDDNNDNNKSVNNFNSFRADDQDL